MTLHIVVRSEEALDAMPAESWIGIVRRGRFRPYEKDSDGRWWCGSLELDPDHLIYGAAVLHIPDTEQGWPVQPWQHPGHRPVQHRDGKAPWCPVCGWTSPVPATPAVQVVQIEDVGVAEPMPFGPEIVDVETGGRL